MIGINKIIEPGFIADRKMMQKVQFGVTRHSLTVQNKFNAEIEGVVIEQEVNNNGIGLH